MEIKLVNRTVTEEYSFKKGYVNGALTVERNKPQGVTVGFSGPTKLTFNIEHIDEVIAVLEAIKAKASEPFGN